MKNWFQILLISTDSEGRPPLSEKVRDYLELFFSHQLQDTKIGKSDWTTILGIIYIAKGNHKLTNTLLSDKSRSIKSDMTKMYEILVPLSLIDNTSDPHKKTIEVLLDAIFLFCKKFAKLKDSEIQEISNKIDWAYLLSFPYPAPRAEQGYLEDKYGFESL